MSTTDHITIALVDQLSVHHLYIVESAAAAAAVKDVADSANASPCFPWCPLHFICYLRRDIRRFIDPINVRITYKITIVLDSAFVAVASAIVLAECVDGHDLV